MSDTYTKLFASITESTIVSEPVPTRWLWVTMLAMSNASGEVYGSIPGLARRANLTMGETETAVACFLSPDPYSRTQDNEGRRIEVIDGGWRLLNHAKYAAVRNTEERREYMREYMRKRREKDDDVVSCDVNAVSSELAELAELAPPALSLALTLEDQELSNSANAPLVGKPPVSPPCPYQRILELYHEKLPVLPRVRELTDERRAKIRARWNNGLGGLDRWENYFAVVEKSDFLMGRCDPSPGRTKPFVADIDFLIRKSTIVKVAEGKYHG